VSDLPKSIRVGYSDFAVCEMSPLAATGKDVFGECDLTMAEIRIRADIGPQKMANTLLHETLHAAYYIGDLGRDDKQERIVTVLANVMSQVWRDNPELVAFINERLSQ
jgi:hypothetical protein